MYQSPGPTCPSINLRLLASYKIDQLTNKNWMIWKERIKMILYLHGVHGHIDRTNKRSEIDEDEIEQWEKEDYITRTLILINIKDDQVVHVSQVKMVQEAWDNLKTIHE
ncbi:hypothetical protein EDB19DRAFT_1633491, partial [Suillus lakei]